MHAQNDRNDSDRILQGYNGQGHQNSVDHTPLDSHLGLRGLESDAIHTPNVFSRDALKRSTPSPGTAVLHCLS